MCVTAPEAMVVLLQPDSLSPLQGDHVGGATQQHPQERRILLFLQLPPGSSHFALGFESAGIARAGPPTHRK